MVTQASYTILLVLVAAQRAVEVHVSRRHEQALRARGAIEHAKEQLPWMVALHASWLASAGLEVWVLDRRSSLTVALPALALFAAGQMLRLSAMRALGARWTVSVMTLPGEPPVRSGPFRYMRHPNYLGVALEVLALPLLHGAYLTAITFSLLNALLLRFRIRAEERALKEAYPGQRAPFSTPHGAEP